MCVIRLPLLTSVERRHVNTRHLTTLPHRPPFMLRSAGRRHHHCSDLTMTWLEKKFGDRNTPAARLPRLTGMGLVGRLSAKACGAPVVGSP